MKSKGAKRGFTIIELLVVMAIIAILAVATIIGLSRQQAKARDTRRISDLAQIKIVLTDYISDNIEPKTTAEYSAIDNGGWDYSSQTGGVVVSNPEFLKFLIDEGYTDKIPVDPINDGVGDVHFSGTGYAYSYYYYKTSTSHDINGYKTYQLNANYEVMYSGEVIYNKVIRTPETVIKR